LNGQATGDVSLFDVVKLRLKLFKFERQLHRDYKRDEAAIAKARKEGLNSSEISMLEYSQRSENQILEDEIAQLETRILGRKAVHYKIPFPDSGEEFWEESSVIGGRQLTTKGFAKLRSEIRNEKNERWKYFELRIKVVVALATALTGLFGVLIGWVVLQK
jgi:hypothetical protein